MLADMAASYPIVEETFAEASAALGYDLWALTQQGPAEELNKTWQTQPALLTASVALYRVWQQQGGKAPAMMAGHSLGEYSALVCAGVIDFADAVRLVGTMGNGGQANYAAAKAGLIGFSKSLAREVASRGITVNVVAPGFIETDMTRALSDDQRAGILAQVPAGRLGGAQEIANAVAFLASDEAAYITGETLHVNGGMYMV
jgi:NAD(P)-dependent dehydrogenase (short-subunit alcohol dehydrogenase family)